MYSLAAESEYNYSYALVAWTVAVGRRSGGLRINPTLPRNNGAAFAPNPLQQHGGGTADRRADSIVHIGLAIVTRALTRILTPEPLTSVPVKG